MKPDQKATIVRFFQERLAEHGYGHAALAWGSQASQYARYAVLADVASPNAESVLDVGAAFGDFGSYLFEERGWTGSYTGYDLNPDIVGEARRRHPDWGFEVRDILHEPGTDRYAYVFGSGILSYFPDMTEQERWETAEAMLRSLWGLCTRALAVNFLSAKTGGEQYAHSWYARPAQILDFCFSLTPRVMLRHDYLPNDFTVYCYRTE